MTKNRINDIIKRTGSIIGLVPDSFEAIVEKRITYKLKLILGCTMFLRVLKPHSVSG